MAMGNHKPKGDVMRLSYWTITLLALFAVGCQSTGGWHEFGRKDGPPTITHLRPSMPSSMYSKKNQSRRSQSQLEPLSEEIKEVRILPPEILSPESRNGNLTTNSKDSGKVKPFPTVFFHLDSWEINTEVQERLSATAKWMDRFPTTALRIEGHTDVRGTESYNMILGAKRAKAVKQYLSDLGVPSQRLETVSYGKLLMVCDVDDEKNCHQFNRRAEMMVQ